MLGQLAPSQETGLNSGPDQRTRQIMVLLLRLGLGIPLLNDGLIGFIAQRMPGRLASITGFPVTQGMALEAARGLPYLEIVVGVALIFGFLTVLSTFAAMAIQLLYHLVDTLSLFLYQTMNMPFTSQIMGLNANARLLILLTCGLMLWLLSSVRDLYSIDTLVFRPTDQPMPPETPLKNRPAPLPLQPRATQGGTDAYLGGPFAPAPTDPPSAD